MANITLKIDDQVLKKARNIARKKKISLDTVVDPKIEGIRPRPSKKRDCTGRVRCVFSKMSGQGWPGNPAAGRTP